MSDYKLTDEQMRDLVKECGLDWHRGFMPLFDGDPTNRYAVLIEAATAPLLERIAALNLQVLSALAQADDNWQRVKELELELAEASKDAKTLDAVMPLYRLMLAVFVPMTSQQQEIAIALRKATAAIDAMTPPPEQPR